MEVNFPALDSKKKKLNEQCNLDESRNRIGNLPEGILLHILSFLPAKDSVQTSILSKRRQCLWMSVTNLKFSIGDEDDKMLFNFVGRLLMLRDPSNIQKFSLSCDASPNESRVNAWISAAVRHKVQVLDLCFYGVCEPSVLLPSSLFTCESWTELKLVMFDDLMLPSVICFSSLKIMTLKHVTFCDDHSPGRLFSGCPVLEKLTLDECDWTNVKSVSISAPMLKTLRIFENSDCENNCEVVIIGTCLQSFDYGGELKNDYSLCNSSSLDNVCIDVYKRRDIEEHGIQRKVAEHTLKLLKGLYNARELILAYANF